MDRVKKQEDGTYVENSRQSLVSSHISIGMRAYIIDAATGNIIKDFKKSDLDACQSTDLDLASTWPTEQQIWQDNSGKTQFNFAPSQVTLCSWFVKWASEQPLKVRHCEICQLFTFVDRGAHSYRKPPTGRRRPGRRPSIG